MCHHTFSQNLPHRQQQTMGRENEQRGGRERKEEKWLMNRIKQILKEINSICVDWWNVKFFYPLPFPVFIRFRLSSQSCDVVAYSIFFHMSLLSSQHKWVNKWGAGQGINVIIVLSLDWDYIWKCMRLSVLLPFISVSISVSFAYLFCFVSLPSNVMNDEMFLWWCNLFLP